MTLFDELKAIVERVTPDNKKVDDGNKAAAKRMRMAAMDIAKLCPQIRKEATRLTKKGA